VQGNQAGQILAYGTKEDIDYAVLLTPVPERQAPPRGPRKTHHRDDHKGPEWRTER
jgi:hypothetical protein